MQLALRCISARLHKGELAVSQKIPQSYAEQNVRLARIIAADPVRYAGIQTVWARLVLAKRQAKA
jgi:hypothetical protein